MKASTRKLHGMLPRMFQLRSDIVNGDPVGADMLTAEGQPGALDPLYPGFATNLARLIEAGLVFAIHEKVEIKSAPNAQTRLASVTQTFYTCLPASGLASHPKDHTPS